MFLRSTIYICINYHKRCKCKFRDKTERTSFVNRSASSNGSSDNRHMSIGSENHDFIGIALFGKHRYAPGELSIINICNEKYQINSLNSVDAIDVKLMDGWILMVAYLPYLNHCISLLSLLCMIQNPECSVDDNIVDVKYFYHYLIYQQRQHHKFPCLP